MKISIVSESLWKYNRKYSSNKIIIKVPSYNGSSVLFHRISSSFFQLQIAVFNFPFNFELWFSQIGDAFPTQTWKLFRFLLNFLWKMFIYFIALVPISVIFLNKNSFRPKDYPPGELIYLLSKVSLWEVPMLCLLLLRLSRRFVL